MAFPLTPVNGQQYEDTTTGRLWVWNSTVPGWIPDDVDVLDDLKDVVTDTTTSLGPASTVASRTAYTAAGPTLDTSNFLNYVRDSFTLTTDTQINSISITITKDTQLTSGIVNLQIYKNSSTGTVAAGSWAAVSATLGSAVLSSNYVNANTLNGLSTFTFASNVLQPGTYTFVVRTFNLDAPLNMATGLNGTVTEVLFSVQGQATLGSVQTGDVLTYDGIQLQWEASYAYGGAGTYDPIVINALLNPTATDVQAPGVFWRNSVTQRVWISQGSGIWWPLPPPAYTSGQAVATRSSTAPTGPVSGQLWFNDDTARLYMWDNEASAWIEV
jgi:hypothetical protein